MAGPCISRSVRPSVFSPAKNLSCAPGAATRSNVGFGMKSLTLPLMMIRVCRPMWANCTAREYVSGRYLVNASGVSYMCWSASKIGAAVNCVIGTSGGQDGRRGGAGPLAFAGFAAQLPDDFVDLAQTGGADGFTVRDQPAVRVDRQRTADLG